MNMSFNDKICTMDNVDVYQMPKSIPEPPSYMPSVTHAQEDVQSHIERGTEQRTFKIEQEKEVSVFDVASFLLAGNDGLSAVRIQKLVYYCQAWSLVWDDKPLFSEKILAWINGPIIRELYDYCRGNFIIKHVGRGVIESLSKDNRETIEAVLAFYGKESTDYLVALSQLEPPWRNARQFLPAESLDAPEISLESMASYYSSLYSSHHVKT